RSARSWSSLALLALVLLAALGLRLYGLNWDGSSMFHPDERMINMTVQGGLSLTPFDLDRFLDPKTSPLNPHFFAYGSFPLYLLKIIAQLLSVVQQSLAAQDLRLVGRALSALFDTGTVLLVYVLGGRIYGRRTGLLAAAFVAFAVLHVQLSHFYTVDVILSFLIVLTIYFCLDIVERGTTRAALFTGAALGLALSTKISVLPLLLAVGIAYLLYCVSPEQSRVVSLSFSFTRLQRSIVNLMLTTAVAGTVFVIAEPYALIDHTTFLANFTEQSEMVRRIRDYPYTRQYIGAPLYFYEFQQLTVWGLGPALGLSFWAGLVFTIMVAWRTRRKSDILLLSWVVPYFVITGWFPVKFLRYLLPMTPFMALMAARMFADVREWAAGPALDGQRWSALIRRLPASPRRYVDGLLALVMVLTIFYALAYDNIYSAPHTAVQTSAWINANVPKGATIVMEHWEEGIPNLAGYNMVTIGPYDDENPDKWRDMLSKLERADYIVFYSNRMYGTIPRLPARYPITTNYYKQLFSGELGFDLAFMGTSYPNLLGVSFVSDTFSRPGLTPPAQLRDFKPSPIAISGGFADESFSVYDHPMTMVFAKNRPLTQNEMRASLGVSNQTPLTAPPAKGSGLMLSPGDLEANQKGGTWSDLFDRDGLVNRLPTLTWLLAVELLFLITLPLGLLLFRALPDRGYLLTKSLGLLLLAYVSWMLSSLHLLPFVRWTILLAGLLILLGSAVAVWRRRDELTSFVIQNRRLILMFELVFLAAFLFDWFLRLANPDLWHPARGGEKPMDFAYLNAVTKTTYFPPYDPWFAGGYMNYYYFGQVIVATLIKLTGIMPSTAYNLAVPLLFACTVAGAFSVAFNLVAPRRHSHRSTSQDSAVPTIGQIVTSDVSPAQESPDALGLGLARLPWAAILCGISAGLFVAVLGNLDGLLQLMDGLWKSSGSGFSSSLPGVAGLWKTLTGLFQVVVDGKPLPAFDYWRSSRMMPPTANITEFPYFTFLFADLHAHLIALPFTLLSLGLALAIVYRGWHRGFRAPLAVAPAMSLPQPEPMPSAPQLVSAMHGHASTSLLEPALAVPARAATVPAPTTLSHAMAGLSGLVRQTDIWGLIVASLVLGALRVINSWDFPTYLAVTGVSLFAGDYFARRRLDFLLLTGVALKAVLVYALSTILFLPFHLTYQLFYNGVQPSQERTNIMHYLGVHGFFLACVGSMIVLESARRWRQSSPWRLGTLFLRRWDHLPRLARLCQRLTHMKAETVALVGWGMGFILVFLLALVAVRLYLFAFLAVFLAAVCVLGVSALRRREAGQESMFFVLLMLAGALALGFGVDLVTIQGDVGRMNTVFKFYLQVWVLMAVSSAYALWWLARWISARRQFRQQRMTHLWIGGLVFLFLSTTIYPLAATPIRLRDRFGSTPLTTDGTAYMQNAEYQEEKGKLALKWDEEGIRWLQDNVQGSPVVLEGNTPLYRWGSRISVYTGLPTVIGWDWHQKQQRWGYQTTVDSRLVDVRTMFSSPSADQTRALLGKYSVRYIYVGELERLYYPAQGLSKFDAMVGTDLTLVYQNEKVKIYQVES
ncbi:MAG: phospholipid carrier-dependent glycosyltransferase, partial [Chloroflexota bacterium]